MGDMSHLAAIALLILQLFRAKNARGISLKTQELRLMVFCSRYLDLFTHFYSLYNSVLKVVYIVTTVEIIYSIKYADPFKSLYSFEQDSFPHWKYCVAPSLVLAFTISLARSGIEFFNILELLWTFSIVLESVAILPQLMVLRKYRLVENLTGKFMFLFGVYRVWYIFNWIYRSNTELLYRHHPLVYVCGVIQVVLYAGFFDQYCKVACGRSLFCWRRCSNCNRSSEDEDKDENDNDLVFEISGDPRAQDPLESQAEPLLEEDTSGITFLGEDLRRRSPEEALGQ